MEPIITNLYETDGCTAIWDITSKCNLSCKHCYQMYNHSIKEFSKEEIDFILDRIKAFGVSHIHLLGGEPLAFKDISYVVKEAKKMEMLITMNTNGTLLTLQKAKELKKAGLDTMVFSMDGATENINDSIRGKGVFKKLTSSIKLAKSEQLNISICYTISKENYCDFENIIIYCLENEIKHLRVVPVYDYSSAKLNGLANIQYIDVLNEFERVINKYILTIRDKELRISFDFRLKVVEYFNRMYGNIFDSDIGGLKCEPGKKYFVIKADATVVPCEGYFNLKNKSINDDIIFNIFDVKSSNSVQIVKKYRDKIFSENYFEICDNCSLFNIFCTPCPFYDRKSLLQCYWAENRLNERRKWLLLALVNLSEGSYIEGNYIFNKLGEKCYINSFLTEFLHCLIQSQKSIDEAISCFIIDSLTDKSKFELVDIIDYLYNKSFLSIKIGEGKTYVQTSNN